MDEYKKSLIKEHSDLIIKITKLNNYIFSKESEKDDKVEFANKCVQLNSMKTYERALRSRMENVNITFDGCTYKESVAFISCEVPKLINSESNNYVKTKEIDFGDGTEESKATE